MGYDRYHRLPPVLFILQAVSLPSLEITLRSHGRRKGGGGRQKTDSEAELSLLSLNFTSSAQNYFGYLKFWIDKHGVTCILDWLITNVFVTSHNIYHALICRQPDLPSTGKKNKQINKQNTNKPCAWIRMCKKPCVHALSVIMLNRVYAL